MIKFYDKNSNEITKYAQKLDVYDFFDSEQMSQCKGKNESSILDYKHYGTKSLKGVYENDMKFYMQCWRLNKFQEGSTFGDEEISKINVGFEGKGIKKSDFKPVEVSGACLTVFAITAEVEYDNNIVSNAKYNSFQIACETAGNKQIKISETSGLNNEDMTPVTFPYTYVGLDEGQTYYCTVYDSDKNAYYYFEVKTKKSLNLKALAPPKIFNGSLQSLINSVQILDVNNNDLSSDNNFKSNIYLRLEAANFNTENYETGWHDLNNLVNLKATNAGIYYVYYFIDIDNLPEYDSEARSAELTQVIVSN